MQSEHGQFASETGHPRVVITTKRDAMGDARELSKAHVAEGRIQSETEEVFATEKEPARDATESTQRCNTQSRQREEDGRATRRRDRVPEAEDRRVAGTRPDISSRRLGV